MDRRGARDMNPVGQNFFILIHFPTKNGQIVSGEILDPPLLGLVLVAACDAVSLELIIVNLKSVNVLIRQSVEMFVYLVPSPWSSSCAGSESRL